MKNQLLRLKQLNKLLEYWQYAASNSPRPQVGWIRVIRKALGMTSQQLANRLGVARSRVLKLEAAEQADAVTLHSLRKVAAALECELVYGFVPKTENLTKILEDKAKEIAKDTMVNVSHSMALEKQETSKKLQLQQQNELAKELLLGPLKHLWNK